MKKWELILMASCFSLSVLAETTNKTVVLIAKKDTCTRANKQLNNNGANEKLCIASVPYFRVLIAIDLGEISTTNKLEKAELRIRLASTSSKPVSFVVAPMVQTTNNNAWGEGAGNLGVQGQKARLGDANFVFSSARDKPWELADGKNASRLSDPALWSAPIATFNNYNWTKDEWLIISLDTKWIESITKSDMKIITFGIWGTSGNGYYFLSAKESASPPELRLIFEKDKEKKKSPTPSKTGKEK